MMDNRTTDYLKFACQKFFEDQDLEQAAADYFGGATVKQKLAEGYTRYLSLLEEAQISAPEKVKKIAEEVAKKLTMTESAYEQDVYETFKEKIADIFFPASVYIPITWQLEELFRNQDDENVMQLMLCSMDEITEYIINRFCNIVVLIHEGIPLEVAEKIADEAGDDEVVPIGIRIQRVSDDENGEEGDEEANGFRCNGECGGRCNCEGKDNCENDGCCQYGNSDN